MGEGGCGQADPSLSKLVLKIIILGGREISRGVYLGRVDAVSFGRDT